MGDTINLPNQAERVRLQLLEMLRPIIRELEHGCSDHHCNIKRHFGMGTNGGCRCLRDLSRDLLEAAVIAEPMSKPFVDRCCWRTAPTKETGGDRG